MKNYLSAIGKIAIALTLGGVSKVAAAERPDIVIFLADDLSGRDISPYDGTEFPTPACQTIADQGMTFDRAYVASPSCAPSRGALLTGRFPIRSGSLFNHQRVRPNVAKWPSFFQKLGYEVVAFGKVAHYAQVKEYGFDHAAFFKYHEDVCVEKAVEWLRDRKSDKPLCFIVGTNWPHVPWPKKEALPPRSLKLTPKLADTPETRRAFARYASAVENADRDLGMIWDATRRHLPKDTVFLFSSDHGAQFPFEKWNLYEHSLRVPLIVVWPGHIKPDSRTSAMVSWVDILPTMIEVAGGNLKADARDLDGRSFLPVLLGNTATHRESVYASHSGDANMNFYPSRSVVAERWKYIRNLDPTLAFHTHIDKASVDTGYWPSWVKTAKTDSHVAELVRKYHHRPAEELYDLESDPEELTNLAETSANAADLERMRETLDTWMQDLGDEGMATDLTARPRQPPGNPDP